MPGTGKKMLMWLGLADADEYEDYEPYEEVLAPPAPRRADMGRAEAAEAAPQTSPAVRTLPREEGTTINLRPVVPTPLRAVPAQAPASGPAAKVHVVAPAEFADAQEIADRFRTGQPVILNLGNAYRELAHRMIDFCSGVAYALGGSMDKVADRVFLMTPSNVELSAEEKRRLQERGLYR